jgi:nitroreductase
VIIRHNKSYSKTLKIKETTMQTSQLIALIQARRTCYQFLPQASNPLPESEINRCLEAAIWAPNHKLTQPWRFWVIGHNMQHALGIIYADNRASKTATCGSVAYQSQYTKALQKFMAIPQIVLVGQALSKDEVTAKEDYAACACAIQNFQLVAWQQSIGVQWSTGPILTDLRSYELLGIQPAEIALIGALYMGRVDAECRSNHLEQTAKRKPVEEVTVYLD